MADEKLNTGPAENIFSGGRRAYHRTRTGHSV